MDNQYLFTIVTNQWASMNQNIMTHTKYVYLYNYYVTMSQVIIDVLWKI